MKRDMPDLFQAPSVFVVDGSRTPFLKAKGWPGPFSAADLAVQTCSALLLRQPFSPGALSEVIMGCMMPDVDEANIGRLIALRLGCGVKTPGWTVQRNCGSGMQAIDAARYRIWSGDAQLVLAGGTEAMSRAPWLFPLEFRQWLGEWKQSKNILRQLRKLGQMKCKNFAPTTALIKGLTDPWVALNMGQTAEILADQWEIGRFEMDQFAVESHMRLHHAQSEGALTEITPLISEAGELYTLDNGVRADTSVEKLAALKPVFEEFGLVTAGNSSQISDGAAAVLLASAEAVEKYRLPVLGRVVDVVWAGLAPQEMGLGPVFAVNELLNRNQLSFQDIDYWEINEAFASTVLSCLKAWASDVFCQKHFNRSRAWGMVPMDHLNKEGGAIALGHPIAASGARLVLHLLGLLKKKGAKRGIATLCIGGGQGGGMLLETVG